jgi:hypothetical protein
MILKSLGAYNFLQQPKALYIAPTDRRLRKNLSTTAWNSTGRPLASANDALKPP